MNNRVDPNARSYNFIKLKNHILSLSENKNDFDKARKEWKLSWVYYTEHIETCPCGVAIKEHCVLQNIQNKRETYVGNVCVYKFIKIAEAKSIFTSLRNIKKATDTSVRKPNAALIEYAYKKGYLYDVRERNFLKKIKKKRKLSPAQKGWLRKINRRIIKKIVVNVLPPCDRD